MRRLTLNRSEPAKISRKIVVGQQHLSGWEKRERNCPLPGTRSVWLGRNQAGLASLANLASGLFGRRRIISKMIERQRATTENMSLATARYSELIQQAERFSTIAASLQALLTALEHQREHLHGALNHLGNLLTAAGDGLPRLEQKITELTRQIEVSVQNTTERLAAASKELTRRVQESHSEMQRLLTQSATDVHKEVNSHVQQLSVQTREQVVALDRALTEELTKSIQTLGEHLTALSRRFVADYTPLTERLRVLLDLAPAE